MAKAPNQPERPRVEPEIIPPGRGGPSDRGASWPPPYGFSQSRSAHRFYVSRIGPFGFALLMLIIGLLAAVMLLILIGTALLWIPVIAVTAVVAAFSGLWRRR
jgi:hypothetical protein